MGKKRSREENEPQGGLRPSQAMLDRHARLMQEYQRAKLVSDSEVLKKNHRFVLREEDVKDMENNWQSRMSIKYYKRLFKEYAIADMARYKEGKVGLRWRTEPEVVNGKGQFICGNKTCERREDLHSYEVNFRYKEHGEVRNELVKVRLCHKCGKKMTYRRDKDRKKEAKRRRKERHRRHRKTGEISSSGDDSEVEEEDSKVKIEAAEEESERAGDEPATISASKDHWKGDAPAVKTEDDEMNDYLSGLFP